MDIEFRLGEKERTREETRKRIEAAERGESVDERHVVNFERLADAALFLRWVSLTYDEIEAILEAGDDE